MVAAVAFRQQINGDAVDPASALSQLISDSAHSFLRPTAEHQKIAIDAVKSLLDPLASSIIKTQTQRREENRRKRKRGSDDVQDPVLQLRQVYTNGLGVKQVWEQARRVLDAALTEAENAVEQQRPQLNGHDPSDELSDDETEGGVDPDESVDSLGEDEADLEDMDEDIDGFQNREDDEEDIEDDSDIMSEAENMKGLEDDFSDEAEDKTYVEDPNKLNDGFFSIDNFNKQTQFLEQMDARGDDDEPSDEDDIDWTADPMTQSYSKPKPGHERRNDAEEDDIDGADDSDDSEAGPTFGNANLDAESEGEDVDLEEMDEEDMAGALPGLSNTNEIRYADFFEPPPKKLSKSKRMRALPKTQPVQAGAGEVQNPIEEDVDALNADMERAMADVRRDIFDTDEEASEDEEDVLSGSDTDNPPSAKSKQPSKNMSTHEKQRAALAAEIARLETLNVSKKSWTLSGEAAAQARPVNSLLEEDLEFERTGKPVPVITAEVTDSIEALIKRRILAREFDEVIRRRPTSLNDAADARRGRVEVDDTKATTGLGELYEQEYQRNADPAAYESKLDKATKKQHDEITKLWNEVRDQLDVLGNLHFKPKRLEVEVKTVEDKPRIAMEDARPGAGDGGDESMLAPQEVYKPGTDSKADKGEVLRKGGASVNKEEMSREEKLRKRRREKERSKKAQGNKAMLQVGADGKVIAKKQSKADKEQALLKDLQKGGVKVIGKGGQMQDLSSGKQQKKQKREERAAIESGSALKL